jgi:LytS/YehU family sensor histidine kinase
MLVQLADLLRDSLARGDAQTVSLARELEFLDKYIEIEMTRFGERLSVVRNVDPVALDAEVPSLLLQPLVENALRHGLAMKPGPGRLTLSAARDGSFLEIRVRDDGAGLPEGTPVPETGVGLGNTRARLEEMYGPDHSFVASMPDGGGFEVVVRLPFRPSTTPHRSGRPTASLGPLEPSGPHEPGAPAAPHGTGSTIASNGSDVAVVPHGTAAAAVSAGVS